MADLKKKFIDILFEDENEEQELTEDSEYKQEAKQSVQEKKGSTIIAKDILYRKPGTSAFINLNEPVKSFTAVNDEKLEEYEMSVQISPIFGLIKENEKKVVNVKPSVIKSQINKPSDSHLDIITSPIYGYGSKEEAQMNNYDVKVINNENEDEELHHLFDEEENLNESYETYESNPLEDEEISLFRLFGDNK